MIRLCLAALPLAFLLSLPATAQEESPQVLKGDAAFGDWKQDAPGVRRLIRPEDLPRPYLTGSSSNGADRVAMPKDAAPRLPPGFTAQRIATGIASPRALRVAPNGDILVADSRAGKVRLYRLDDKGGTAEATVFAGGLNRPYGMAFYPAAQPRWLYVANTDGVVRFPYRQGDLEASGKAETVVAGLPTGGHWTRDIAFSKDGGTLYVSIGSASNAAEGMAPPPGGLESWTSSSPLGAAWGSERGRAEVRAYDPDGGNGRVFATGLRNCSGMTVEPRSGALWCAVNERDALGDNLPSDYATRVAQRGFYGWPWYYIGDHEDPRHKGARPDLAGKVTVPDFLIQAHSAPLGIAFYEGDGFPSDYKGDAFVALHGSWNRGLRTGYKVVRLLFENGQPTGAYEDFMTGFVVSDTAVWGRPVGVAAAPDGSLIVSEDGSGTLWRVTYRQNPG